MIIEGGVMAGVGVEMEESDFGDGISFFGAQSTGI